jgi:hypothetical protein
MWLLRCPVKLLQPRCFDLHLPQHVCFPGCAGLLQLAVYADLQAQPSTTHLQAAAPGCALNCRRCAGRAHHLAPALLHCDREDGMAAAGPADTRARNGGHRRWSNTRAYTRSCTAPTNAAVWLQQSSTAVQGGQSQHTMCPNAQPVLLEPPVAAAATPTCCSCL